ncbi:MAG: regulatory protein RecX [Magnetococcales bacterium]|nr:regulatory protein RecX [Magnetococcales bacterium]
MTERALALLARRPYGRRELESRLLSRGAPEAEVREVMARFEALGYLDDRAFAEAFARERLLSRGRGPERVRLELVSRGLEEGDVGAALEAALGEVDPETLARRCLEKRLRLEGRRVSGQAAMAAEAPGGLEGPGGDGGKKKGPTGGRREVEGEAGERGDPGEGSAGCWGEEEGETGGSGEAWFWREYRRHYDFLRRRGFAHETIARVLAAGGPGVNLTRSRRS